MRITKNIDKVEIEDSRFYEECAIFLKEKPYEIYIRSERVDDPFQIHWEEHDFDEGVFRSITDSIKKLQLEMAYKLKKDT